MKISTTKELLNSVKGEGGWFVTALELFGGANIVVVLGVKKADKFQTGWQRTLQFIAVQIRDQH